MSSSNNSRESSNRSRLNLEELRERTLPAVVSFSSGVRCTRPGQGKPTS